jgi:hypothetical protein
VQESAGRFIRGTVFALIEVVSGDRMTFQLSSTLLSLLESGPFYFVHSINQSSQIDLIVFNCHVHSASPRLVSFASMYDLELMATYGRFMVYQYTAASKLMNKLSRLPSKSHGVNCQCCALAAVGRTKRP